VDAADEVLRDDPLHHVDGHRVVPHAVGIDDGDGALLADP